MHKSPSTLYSQSHYADSWPVISEVSRMLTHLLTDDLVVETQIAGGGSADLSSSIWAREKDSKRLNDSEQLALSTGMTEENTGSILKTVFHSLKIQFSAPRLCHCWQSTERESLEKNNKTKKCMWNEKHDWARCYIWNFHQQYERKQLSAHWQDLCCFIINLLNEKLLKIAQKLSNLSKNLWEMI